MTTNDRKGVVVAITSAGDQTIGEGLGGGAVGVNAAEAAQHKGRSGVFVNVAGATETQVGGGFVEIVDPNGEGLLNAEAALVGGAHPNAIGRFGLKVGAAVNPQLVTVNGEGTVVAIAGAGDQAVGKGVTAVGVSAAQGTHHGVGRHIFIQAGGTEAEVGGGVANVKGKQLLVAI